jgi:hypothetical protein
LSEEGEAIDRFQFMLESFGYVDPCSGNIYPIITYSPASGNTLPIYIIAWNGDEHDCFYLFPVLIFLDGKLELALLGVGQ